MSAQNNDEQLRLVRMLDEAANEIVHLRAALREARQTLYDDRYDAGKAIVAATVVIDDALSRKEAP